MMSPTEENTKKKVPETRQEPSPEGALPSYISTLYSICQEENIKFWLLSKNWLKRLEKNGQVRFIVGRKFDLNPAGAGKIADDKYATFAVLSDQGLPIIEHALIYPSTNQQEWAIGCNSVAYAERFWASHNRSIVIKPNAGTLSHGVVWIREREQLPIALAEVFRWDNSASMCPFYTIRNQYRAVVLDDEVCLAYANADWLFNLGPRVENPEIDEPLRAQISQLAKQAVRAMGLRFCTVDFIRTAEDELFILEVNSGVMLDKYCRRFPEKYPEVKEIFRAAIRKMFAG